MRSLGQGARGEEQANGGDGSGVLGASLQGLYAAVSRCRWKNMWVLNGGLKEMFPADDHHLCRRCGCGNHGRRDHGFSLLLSRGDLSHRPQTPKERFCPIHSDRKDKCFVAGCDLPPDKENKSLACSTPAHHERELEVRRRTHKGMRELLSRYLRRTAGRKMIRAAL